MLFHLQEKSFYCDGYNQDLDSQASIFSETVQFAGSAVKIDTHDRGPPLWNSFVHGQWTVGIHVWHNYGILKRKPIGYRHMAT